MGCSTSNPKFVPVTTSHSVTTERQTSSYGNHKSQNNLDHKQKRSHGNLDDKGQSIHDNLAKKHRSSDGVLSDKDNNIHSNLDDKHKSSQSNLDDKHKSSQSNLDDKHKSSQSNLDDKHESSQSNLDDIHESSQSNLDDIHESSQSNLDDKHESSQSNLDDIHESSQSNLDDKHESSQSNLDDIHKSSQSNLVDKHESSQSNLDDKHESSQSNLDDIHESSQSNLDDKHESSQSNLDDIHESSKSNLDDKHESSQSNLDDMHESSQSNLDDIHESSQSNLDDKQKSSQSNLDDKHESSQSNLDDIHKSSQSNLDDKHKFSQSNLDDKHKSSQSNLDVQPKIKKADEEHDYKKIDEHARKAPDSVKNSAADLVNYMSTVSKDPRMLVRGFFVWISENIAYDVDGFFGRTSRAPCNAESVMKGGSSVCAGYANVMELLCRQAGVPVKNISGYAKGYSISVDNPFTLDKNTNHAWNAVQLEGKWYLIDSTWGAGHLDDSKAFEREFKDFYFLTDPEQFISSHFPYMDKNMEESMKWQLLTKPMSLDQFNKNVKYAPEAFKLGAKAVSHQHGYIEMKNELQMTFKSTRKEELVVSATLILKERNMLQKQPNATFGYLENGLYKLLIRPPRPGSYKLNVFGRTVSDVGLYITEYTINCTEVKERDFEYPMAYGAAQSERSVLHEPLRGKLPGNTDIKFHVSAPYLQNVMIGDTYFEKSGTTFSGNISTGAVGQQIIMYGTRGDKYSRMQALYGFKTV